VLDFNPGDPEPAAMQVSEDSPSVILSAEGAANGLEDILNQTPEVQDGEVEVPVQPGEPEDPGASTIKTSRNSNKKRRR
jgi:hypothetical protein